ncbi:MAG: hypothetical protein J6Y20_07785 [Lachnospiraceae bacterium]|nr:hypothetical protein [Lachnospiraceae bacterium]
MYKRKSKDEYALEYDYGYGDGTEVLCWCETYKEAREDQKAYIENEGIFPIIKKHRVKI